MPGYMPTFGYFNPRSPRGGATPEPPKEGICNEISIHAPHEGERRKRLLLNMISLPFQSTLPTRGSDRSPPFKSLCHRISIHAPHEGERRGGRLFIAQAPRHISIHAPHEGERRPILYGRSLSRVFQSTLPTRGSDRGNLPKWARRAVFQSTLPTRGSDMQYKSVTITVARFQSTLPTRGSDGAAPPPWAALWDFNPRSPRGGATISFVPHGGNRAISIHAPHEGERRIGLRLWSGTA